MRTNFLIKSIFLGIFALNTLIFNSCIVEDNINSSFFMTTDNVSFVFPDTTVQLKGDIITLQKLKSVTSSEMPKYYQYGFFVDSVAGPVSSSLILPLVRLTKDGYRTGEFIFDNTTNKFIPGDYQVYLGALTLDGKVYFRNIPINVKLQPGFSASLLSKLTIMNYPVGEPVSVEGAFTLNSHYMVGQTISVTSESSDFLISSTTGTNFSGSTSISVTPTTDLGSKKIYVRMRSGLQVGDSLSGNITIESSGMRTLTLNVKGKVLPVKINSTTTTISSLDYYAGSGPSIDKTFTVSGDLTNNLIISPPANFEIAREVSGVVGAYTSNPVTLTKISGGLVLPTILHVRLKKDLGKGTYNDVITLTSFGASAVSVDVNGTVY